MSASQSDVEGTNNTTVGRIFATKQNSAIKWQRARGVIGALEVKSEPYLDIREELQPHLVKGNETIFHHAVKAWEDLKLRQDFIKTVKQLPTETCCCGFMSDDDATKRNYVELLNNSWCKQATKKLNQAGHAFKVDTFLWNWQNASGKSESNIIMIRFFELSTNRFKRALSNGSLDLELINLDDDETPGGIEVQEEGAKMER